ncbi:DHA2 family efflux MFS transporter permease subunit [Microbacterium protaetiae]|uniref:DHA2 family efflux MFS transporter permease subunit n=1 Tax=Microbacterium protaetiae TaxID=2509458 RepID=A0A4P6EGJ8_9MICO|nr:MFS transporter [Microbacterium protaetiae]QAY60289.1 DHA2 family efflux MFS transporter permease subunit [Microbacterium protaetiae]
MPARTSPSTRWWALIVLALTQLVVVLDGTIVNIALPQAQADLGFSDGQRQWVVTAYALAFGALLLLGGRIADYWGRKRTYVVGMIGFGAASAFGGLAQSGAELIIARGLQGAFAAMLAPAALALLTVTFPSGRDRNVAFAVFGTVAGAGAAVGLVLGGVLTEFADWRWCLLVNLFFVVVGLVGAALFLSESRAGGENRYDWPGAVVVTLGLGSLVYGFSLAEIGWGSPWTIGFLAAGVLLLVLFVWIEATVAQPLLPLRVVTDRVRGGAFLIQAVAGSVMIGSTLYLTFHLQIVLGMPALWAGIASLPIPLATMVAAPFATRMLSKIGPRPLLIGGPLIVAASLLYLSRITADGAYAVEVLPALIVMGVGMGFIFVPLQNLALYGVAPHDAGAASATANSAMQIGGSIGLSVFTAIYAAALGGMEHAVGDAAQLASAYGATFVAAAIGMVLAAVIALVLVRGTKAQVISSEKDVLVHVE